MRLWRLNHLPTCMESCKHLIDHLSSSSLSLSTSSYSHISSSIYIYLHGMRVFDEMPIEMLSLGLASLMLNQSLARAEKDKPAFIAALRDAEAECDAIDSKIQEVLERQITVEEECVSLLEQFATALEVKKLELEIESHLISDTRLLLNDSIEHAAEDERREREFLCKRKDTLMDELETLLALVREKEYEIAENDANIKAVDKRIADVVSGFQEMHSSINMKYDNLQSSLSQTELESEALSTKKKEIDDLLSEEEERGAKLRELARISADEAKAYEEVVGLRKSFALSIVKSRVDKLRLAKTEEKLSEEVQILRQEISAARASLQELSSTKSSIQQEIASCWTKTRQNNSKEKIELFNSKKQSFTRPKKMLLGYFIAVIFSTTTNMSIYKKNKEDTICPTTPLTLDSLHPLTRF
ncbi:hypothetical protein AAG906_012504 [Vitis piasezkii]